MAGQRRFVDVDEDAESPFVSGKKKMGTPRGINSLIPGSLSADRKWKNSKLSQDLKLKFNKVLFGDLGIYDFHLPGNKFILYVPESDLVASVDKDRFRNVDKHNAIVVAVRNTITAEQYSNLQDDLVVDSGCVMLPIGDSSELPDLLHQFSLVDGNATPKKTPKREGSAHRSDLLLAVPGLGKTKAEKLINTFGTINRIALCSVGELSSVLGLNLAAEVHKFFH